jgi:glycosyltransferase involved in cell wall biosynthesis
MQPTFSIILPLYKQREHASLLANRYINELKKLSDSWEVIFVINGPEDGTERILKEAVKNQLGIKIFRLADGGWGQAVKFGLKEASGKYICYTNSARTSIKELVRVLTYAKVNDDTVVKATRIVRQEWFRKLGSILYNLENRTIFKTPVWDVNGTPKVIPKKILQKIFPTSENDLIDAELMAKCYKNNIPIIEIPIMETNRVSGKSTTNIASAVKMYWGLFKLRKTL